MDLSKKAMITQNYKELDDAIRMKIPQYLYNGGKVKQEQRRSFLFGTILTYSRESLC